MFEARSAVTLVDAGVDAGWWAELLRHEPTEREDPVEPWSGSPPVDPADLPEPAGPPALPGPAAATWWAGQSLDGASRMALLDAAAGWQQLQSWSTARQAEVLAALPQPPCSTDDDVVREEVAVALHVAPDTAGAYLAFARTLTGPSATLPATYAALLAGRLTVAQAHAIVDPLLGVDRATARAVEQQVLPDAPDTSPARLGQRTRAALLATRPADQEDTHRRERATRYITRRPGDHGMAWIQAYLTDADSQTIWTALDALSDRAARRDAATGTRRTTAQRRADVFTDVFRDLLRGGDLPTQHGDRPTLHLLARPDTLTGHSSHPAWLAGVGPILPSTARRLLGLHTDQDEPHTPAGRTTGFQATGRRNGDGSTQPPGLPDRGSGWSCRSTAPPDSSDLDPLDSTAEQAAADRYRIPRALARQIGLRDQMCRFPGCTHPAPRCDLDHVEPHPDGTTPTDATARHLHGRTTSTNVLALCRRHHRLKTHHGWTLTGDADTCVTWTSPTGRRTRSSPPQLLPPGHAPPDHRDLGPPPF